MSQLALLMGAIIVLTSSSAVVEEPSLYRDPTEAEIKAAFSDYKLKAWSSLERYQNDFDFDVKRSNERQLKNKRKDPDFDECDTIFGGLIECDDCLPCEKEVVAFDSCGFMTGRMCMKVSKLPNGSAIENCKKQGEAEQNGDEKCTKLVNKIRSRVDKDGRTITCNELECVSIDVDKGCKEHFPEPNCNECEEIQNDGLTKCNVRCPIKKCVAKPIGPMPPCENIRVQNNPNGVHVCKVLKTEECGNRKCVYTELNVDERDDLIIEAGVVKCKEKCHIPKVTETTSDNNCAKKIECEKDCPPLRCPPPGLEECPMTIATAPMFYTDGCECKKLHCTPMCPPSPPCSPPGKLHKSPNAKKCKCPADLCVKDPCKGDACCKPGDDRQCCKDASAGGICEGENPDQTACCPKDEEGCFKCGKSCSVRDGNDYKKIKDGKDCEKKCPSPHTEVKPKPLCCFGDDCKICNKEPDCCNKEPDCCVDGCCKMARDDEWNIVGSRCPPTCDSKKTCRGGVKDGKESCYLIDDRGEKDPCPEGKCCCREKGEIVKMECPKQCPNEYIMNNKTKPKEKTCGDGTRTPCETDDDCPNLIRCRNAKTPKICADGTRKPCETDDDCPDVGDRMGRCKEKRAPALCGDGTECESSEECTDGSDCIVRPPPCDDFLDVYDHSTLCCWGKDCGCAEDFQVCPEGKSCCMKKDGSLHVNGEHCCKGEGCCTITGGKPGCCEDDAGCCGNGCFKHCKRIKANGENGFLDHFAKAHCKCRDDLTQEICTELADMEPMNENCRVHLKEVKCCQNGLDIDNRKVCQEDCSYDLGNFLKRFARRN